MAYPSLAPEEIRDYSGPERRTSSRIRLEYPICIRFASPSGSGPKRFARTVNVSPSGVLFACAEMLEPGANVDVSIGIPSARSDSLLEAQVNGAASVVRSEPAASGETDSLRANVALKFLETPNISMEISMFD